MEDYRGRKFRFENKYMITSAQIELLRCHIEELCSLDSFSDGVKGYNIRSVYFDDYANNSYKDNEIGSEPRNKFRIRIYNHDASKIYLEEKIKVGGKITKDRAVVDREFCEAVLKEEGDKLSYPTESPVLNRFLLAYHTKFLRPRIIVEYDRSAYVYPDGDVRITFDTSIAFSDEVEAFFEKDIFLQPIMPLHKELLEVKYTEFIPDFIHEALNIKQLQQNTFSKYYLCQKYKRSGGYEL